MGRLFRRVVRTARRPRRASGGTTVRSADGKQYRVVAVDEAKDTEFADPPRKWGRVGVMAGAWAVALAMGGWIAPGFAASGNPDNVDSRDETAESARQTTNRYLRYGSDLDVDRSRDELCDGASPEVTPSALDAIRQDYEVETGGITRVDIETSDPVDAADGTTVTATVSYISDAKPKYEDFIVTVQEEDGGYCVSNAVQVSSEEPGEGEGTGEVPDAETIATDFMRTVVRDRDPQTAAEFQCESEIYTGATAEEIDAAINEWAAANGETSAFLSLVDPAESSETSVTAFAVQITLKAALNEEDFDFVIGVQEDCVVSVAGGDGLL